MGAVAGINSIFGAVGFNPALALAYIIFEETTILSDPNLSLWQIRLCGIKSTENCDSDHPTYFNHYLWAYLIAPFVGAVLGGILFHIHAKCTEKKGADNNKDSLIDLGSPDSDWAAMAMYSYYLFSSNLSSNFSQFVDLKFIRKCLEWLVDQSIYFRWIYF